MWWNIYIYTYLFGFASVARNLNSEIHHMTLHTFPDGGSVQVSYFHSPWFFQETLRFTNLVSRHFRHYVAEVKANQWGGATGQASMQKTDSVDEMAHDHISGMWKKLQQKMNI